MNVAREPNDRGSRNRGPLSYGSLAFLALESGDSVSAAPALSSSVMML